MYDPTVDGYTTRPTHVRVTSDGREWFVDGADAAGNYTEACWTYDSFAEAIAEVPEFVANQERHNGVVWEWRAAR